MGQWPAWPMKVIAQIMAQNTPLDGLSKVLDMLSPLTGKEKCRNILSDDSSLSFRSSFFKSKVSGMSNKADIAWGWQWCNEFGVPMNSNGRMFAKTDQTMNDIDKQCMTQWNVKPDHLALHRIYGDPQLDMPPYSNDSDKPTKHTKIIFTNGMLDPWKPGGFFESRNH